MLRWIICVCLTAFLLLECTEFEYKTDVSTDVSTDVAVITADSDRMRTELDPDVRVENMVELEFGEKWGAEVLEMVDDPDVTLESLISAFLLVGGMQMYLSSPTSCSGISFGHLTGYASALGIERKRVQGSCESMDSVGHTICKFEGWQLAGEVQLKFYGDETIYPDDASKEELQEIKKKIEADSQISIDRIEIALNNHGNTLCAISIDLRNP